MFKEIFIYQGINTPISSDPNEKIKIPIDSLLKQNKIDSNNLYFLYNGEAIDPELPLNQICNNSDKERQEMIVLVENISNSTVKIKKPKTKEVICPTCKENIFLSIKDYRLNLYDCINRHNTNNISLIEYEKTQEINSSNNCDICKDKDKNNANINKRYFKCIECKNKICQFCKEQHDNSHHLFDYDYKSFICYKHNNFYIKYCYDCKTDICTTCEEEHENHNIISFKDIIPKEDEIIKQNDIFKEKIAGSDGETCAGKACVIV